MKAMAEIVSLWRLSRIGTSLADFFPGVGRVHELRVLDLVMDVLVLVEGEGSRQAHVDNNPH